MRGGERSQQLLKLDLAEWVVLDWLQVSLMLVVRGSWGHGLTIGVEEGWVRVNCCTDVAGVADLSAVGSAARSVEAAFSGELRAALELVTAICVGRRGIIVVNI